MFNLIQSTISNLQRLALCGNPFGKRGHLSFVRRCIHHHVVLIGLGMAQMLVASAQDLPPPRESRTTIACGDSVFMATTKYYLPGTPEIEISGMSYVRVSERITWKGGEVQKKLWSNAIRSEQLTTDKPLTGYSPYAFDWTCISNGARNFMVVGFSSGGNCVDCEWLRIYDAGGRILLNTRGHSWKRTVASANAIGLPKNWVDQHRSNSKRLFEPK